MHYCKFSTVCRFRYIAHQNKYPLFTHHFNQMSVGSGIPFNRYSDNIITKMTQSLIEKEKKSKLDKVYPEGYQNGLKLLSIPVTILR